MDNPIFYPLFAMVALTCLVWLKLFLDRIGEIRSRKLNPESLATAEDTKRTLQNINSADHFVNLFEMPVLFYVLCLSLALTQTTGSVFILGAWLFVFLRALQAFIHCTYNRVLHRFWAYLSSSVVLWILWILFAIEVSRRLSA